MGADGTCKTSTGIKQLDYLLASADLIPFISNMKVVNDVVWSPHAAITFDVDRRPERVHFQTISKPAPLTYDKDEKGKPLPWTTTADDWINKLLHCKEQAEKAIDSTRDDDNGTWQHANSIGAAEQIRNISIRYAQWSMAIEETVIGKSMDKKHSNKQRGRGLQPSNLPIEHVIWSLPKPLARAGSDLFSTLWIAIAGALRAIASARRLDDSKGLDAHA